jgi:hypothetical protein
MQTEMKFAKVAVLAVAATLLVTLSTLATAESETARAIRSSAATTPTTIPGIHAYAEPPKEFNPVTATDEELAVYGFPLRPDKLGKPEHYAAWEQAMKAAKIRWNGKLKVLPFGGQGSVAAGSSPLPEAVRSDAGPSELNVTNASGVVLSNNRTAWSSKNSFNLILARFSVPVTQFALGTNRWQPRLKREHPTCTGRHNRSSRVRMEGWRQWQLGWGDEVTDQERCT